MVSLKELEKIGRLSRTGNAAVNWSNWEDNFRNYASKSNLSAEPAPKQAATLRYAMGAFGKEVMKSLDLNESQRNDIEYILRTLREYFMPTDSLKLLSNDLEGEQSFQEYKRKVRAGDFDTQENEGIRGKLVKIKDLALEKSKEMCLIEENAMKDIREEEKENEISDKTVFKRKSNIAIRKCQVNAELKLSNNKRCLKKHTCSFQHCTFENEERAANRCSECQGLGYMAGNCPSKINPNKEKQNIDD